ncbi:alpha/beta hydrolase [Phenylobacterium sp.]|uniref:alpha/beta hydrolase n=1 Tax=Phenylobacterium sp. TaxID=1871053 RepID=UPI0035689EE7
MKGAKLDAPRDLSFRLKGATGKAVLLVHGMTGAPGEMKVLAKKLHRRGFSVAAPMLAGHGFDEASLLKTGWRDWLGTVRTAFEQLQADHDEVYVAGICVGGALGVALAAEEPRLAGTAVYSMTYRYDGWNMKRWYSAVTPFMQPFANLPLLRRISFEEPYPFGLKDERLRDGTAAAQGAVIIGALDRLPLGSMWEMHDLGEHIDRVGGRVIQPTLIIHARDDDMSDPRNAYRLQRALAGPTALHLLDDCYHMVHVDRQRDLVADLTADYFGAPPAAPAPVKRSREPADA